MISRRNLLLGAGSTAAGTLLPGPPAAAAAKAGDPADDLPPHVTRLTWFGERADWRHDGKRFVFLNRAYGDVYEYELATGRITPCTDHVKHHGFVRALYLWNGDLFLSGPKDTFDRADKEARQKARDASYLWVLDKSFTKPPVPLGVPCNAGPAVSRTRPKLAWTHGEQDHISTGEIAYAGGTPKLVNARVVLRTSDFPAAGRPRKWVETQNFVPPHDDKLTVTAYEIGDTANTETYLFDLAAGKLTNLTNTPDRYEECEGVFPDGGWTLVESAERPGVRWPLVDLYKVAQDGSGRRERLTHFTDYKGWKGAEGVVSDDGKFMLFQNGKSGQESGAGFGIFLYDFAKARAGK
jgi:hypothetical protein